MKKLQKIINSVLAFFASIFLFQSNAFAQDQPHFTMYFIQPTVINPAAMGAMESFNGALFFNKQLLGFDKSPMVGLLDVNAPIAKTNFYAGMQFSQDRIGVSTHSIFSGNAAYRIQLGVKQFLSLGMGLSAKLRQANFSEAPVINPNDPVFLQNAEAIWTPDIRLGAYYFSDDYYVGFAVANIFSNSLNFSGITPQAEIRVDPNDMHFYLNGGWKKRINPDWTIMPSALFRLNPGAPLQLDVNAMALFKEMLGFGLTYRTASTIGVNVYYQFSPSLVAGYAFNAGLRMVSDAGFTGHEVILAYRLKNNKKIIPADRPRF